MTMPSSGDENLIVNKVDDGYRVVSKRGLEDSDGQIEYSASQKKVPCFQLHCSRLIASNPSPAFTGYSVEWRSY
ncbi:hypothetical protein [Pseudomonas sp. LD120]|uniref:hypothetical protein n=1 Tax=Pseudomonas sp. LD120 TaxID=485751 RepID=UPI00135BC3B9|nr:hypothetical protein [Pseudomonas sp. LD120]KAF0866599.1 hypothetical protein PLD_04740 [Pseudomonas sp. LD120]